MTSNEWNKAHREIMNEVNRRWKENNPGAYSRHKRVHGKKWRALHSFEHNANNRLWKAILSGKVIRPDTCPCGNPDPEGHHTDYSKPLMVVWLCHKCHTELHRRIGSLGREIIKGAHRG
jgi:hypothetical protein